MLRRNQSIREGMEAGWRREVRKGLSEKGTFAWRPEGSEGGSAVEIWVGRSPGRWTIGAKTLRWECAMRPGLLEQEGEGRVGAGDIGRERGHGQGFPSVLSEMGAVEGLELVDDLCSESTALSDMMGTDLGTPAKPGTG